MSWYYPLEMGLTISETLLWWLGIGLKVLLCALVFYRRLYRRLPFFSLYVLLLVAKAALLWSVYREWGFLSRAAWYAGWSAELVVLLARALVVAELCWTSLRNYPGIWSLVRKLLAVVVLVVFTYAAFTTFSNRFPISAFILTSEQGLEVLFMAVLASLLGSGVWYKVQLGGVERNIIVGLGIYSVFQVLNNTLMNHWMMRYFHWWNLSREVSFDVAMIVWMIPLRKTLALPEPAATLISKAAAVRLLPQVLANMRKITDELKRIARLKWK